MNNCNKVKNHFRRKTLAKLDQAILISIATSFEPTKYFPLTYWFLTTHPLDPSPNHHELLHRLLGDDAFLSGC